MKFKPKAVFLLGDLVSDGYDEGQWRIFNEITAEMRKEADFYPVLGNHDKESPLYFANFGFGQEQRWYAVLKYGINFIILDSNVEIGPGSEQYKWLESQLRRNPAYPAVILLHRPLFTLTPRHKDADRLREQLLPLLQRYAVLAVFSGHDHSYQRFFYNGIYFIVTPSAGGTPYNREVVNPYNQIFLQEHGFFILSLRHDVLAVDVYGLDLNLLDHFEIMLNKGYAQQRASGIEDLVNITAIAK